MKKNLLVEQLSEAFFMRRSRVIPPKAEGIIPHCSAAEKGPGLVLGFIPVISFALNYNEWSFPDLCEILYRMVIIG